jgi:hypothetical protein
MIDYDIVIMSKWNSSECVTAYVDDNYEDFLNMPTS